MRSEAWLTSDEMAGEDGLGLDQQVPGRGEAKRGRSRYLSKIDLTSSKQVSWRSCAASSLALGSLGTMWVIKLSIAFVMRSGAMAALSQATSDCEGRGDRSQFQIHSSGEGCT